MGITTTKRPAKCKDCKYLQPFFRGISLKRKHYRCLNTESGRVEHKFATISPSDLVCDKWKLIGAPDIKSKT